MDATKHLTDGLVAAVATGVALAVAMSFGSVEPTASGPGYVGIGLLVATGTTLLARQRWPVAVLLAVFGVTYLYLALDFPGGAELPLLAVAVYSAAAAGHRAWVAGVTGVFVVGGLLYRLLVDQEHLVLIVLTVVPLVLVALLGDGVYVRRQLRAEVRERLRILELEKEHEARARLTTERLRIAHELHDVLAHTITTMTVQAGAAADGLPDDSEAGATLRTLRASARDALQQVRATVAVLRSEDGRAARLPSPGLDHLAALVGSVEAAGLAVEVDAPDAPRRPLPAAVDLTAYRIVQEALTNVIRHAGTGHARVAVRHDASSVTVTVEDDGAGRGGQVASTTSNGFGLRGMRERAESVGGRLEAGPRPEGGFRVQAVLPAGTVTS